MIVVARSTCLQRVAAVVQSFTRLGNAEAILAMDALPLALHHRLTVAEWVRPALRRARASEPRYRSDQ
jgi:hypothetical protein